MLIECNSETNDNLFFSFHRPTSRVGMSESSLPITNYQDYNEINNYPHSNIHVSDSNIRQGYYRPQSRGLMTSSSSENPPSRGPISSTSSDQPRSRGPTPLGDQRFREPTPNVDHRVRGPTPTQDWYHNRTRDVQRDSVPSNRDIPQSEGYNSRNGGFYGNANMGYRDPVFSAIGGKRPVKTLGQPNSAKV